MGIRELIEKADDLPKVKVEIPEWKLSLWVRRVPAEGRDDLERLFVDADRAAAGGGAFVAELFALVACDEHGDPLYDWAKDDDRAAVLKKSVHALSRVVKPAAKVNGGIRAEAEASLEKSEAAPDSDSGSA